MVDQPLESNFRSRKHELTAEDYGCSNVAKLFKD